MHSRFVTTNNVRLHLKEDGPADGPLVILLHGFPEFWYAWRYQIAPLAEAGFRVWAPDQRGYNLSDKPLGVNSYTIDKLGADIIGLINAAGVQTATVVGHDWGGGVAWWLAMNYPDRLNQVIFLNMPHPGVMLQHLRRSPRQLLRSWYVGFFQIPWLPEWLARLGNWWFVVQALRRTSRPGTFSRVDLDRYRQAWAMPGPTGTPAYRTMIHWYRAFVRQRPGLPTDTRIVIPVLIIWGKRDQFLMPDLAQRSLERCDNGQLVILEEATHWVQHEAAEKVNALIISCLPIVSHK